MRCCSRATTSQTSRRSTRSASSVACCAATGALDEARLVLLDDDRRAAYAAALSVAVIEFALTVVVALLYRSNVAGASGFDFATRHGFAQGCLELLRAQVEAALAIGTGLGDGARSGGDSESLSVKLRVTQAARQVQS